MQPCLPISLNTLRQAEPRKQDVCLSARPAPAATGLQPAAGIPDYSVTIDSTRKQQQLQPCAQGANMMWQYCRRHCQGADTALGIPAATAAAAAAARPCYCRQLQLLLLLLLFSLLQAALYHQHQPVICVIYKVPLVAWPLWAYLSASSSYSRTLLLHSLGRHPVTFRFQAI